MILRAHLFRFAGDTHVVTSTRSKVKRHEAVTMCAKRIPDQAQRIAPHHEPGRTAPVTCDSCSRSLAGLMDVLETDFGFSPPTKHGRK